MVRFFRFYKQRLLIILFFCCTQSLANDKQHPYFTLTETDIVVEQQVHRLFIAQPKTPAPKTGYPILYMLDGNKQFSIAVDLYKPEHGTAPLIVALGYPIQGEYDLARRTLDYTPPAIGDEFASGGGAEKFHQLIENNVKPLIFSQYPINKQQQTLSGHSFGGLFTLYTLFNHTDSFQHYVANSPSIWWGDGVVIPKQAPLLSKKPASLAITVGEYEENPTLDKKAKPASAERIAKLAKRKQVTKARELSEVLQQQGINVSFILFPAKNHGTVIPDAVNLAVIVAGQSK